MRGTQIPGVSIALIRNNQIAWAEGFGISNRLSGKPITSNSAFEVASISKPVTAYIALRLVDTGLLSLDDPVHLLLKDPFLPSSINSNKITLRHLLSHSSGLGDDVLFNNKQIMFEPGTDFFYSGIGFEYIKELIEQTTDMPLEKVARELVFEPMNMSGSSFINSQYVDENIVNGHIRYLIPMLVFIIPFILITTMAGIVLMILNRILHDFWQLKRNSKIIVCIATFLITALLLNILAGKPFPNLVRLSVIISFVFLLILSFSFVGFNRLVMLISDLNQKKYLKTLLTSIWMIMTIVLLLFIASNYVGPAPKNNSIEASAIGSLRSNAVDLATFIIEMADSKYLSSAISEQIDSVQQNINQDFSWGLGIGIQHTSDGNAIWQNGITFAFRSIMVIYPELGHGVVVFTNSEAGLNVAYDIAERALGGEAKWKFF